MKRLITIIMTLMLMATSTLSVNVVRADETAENQKTEEVYINEKEVQKDESVFTDKDETEPEEFFEEDTPEETSGEPTPEVKEETEEVLTASVITSGTCGDEAYYTLYSDYSLKITGSGKINRSTYNYLYDYYEDVRSLTIASGITSISSYAFGSMESLESISLPNTLTTIKDYAFSSCKNLKSVTIPANVNSIGVNPFSSCNSLTSISVNTNNSYYESKNCNVIIEKSTGMLVSGCKNSIVPDTVLELGKSAFNGCKDFSCITLPSSVKTIGEFAFAYSDLATIILNEGLETIQTCAFCDSYLSEITIPASVTDIEPESLTTKNIIKVTVNPANSVYRSSSESCAVIEKATDRLVTTCGQSVIPDGVKIIGENALQDANGSEVSIPLSVNKIESQAFNSNYLTKVIYAGSAAQWKAIENDDSYGFRNAEIIYTSSEGIDSTGFTFTYDSSEDAYSVSGYIGNSKIIEIPQEKNSKPVIAISDNAFKDNKIIEDVYLPESIEYIGESAFENCSSLQSVIFRGLYFSLDSVEKYTFRNCISLMKIKLPDTVEVINENAFENCYLPGKFYVPSGLTKICSYAFKNTDINYMYLSEKVQVIEANAFAGCDSYFHIYTNMASKPSGWQTNWDYLDSSKRCGKYFDREKGVPNYVSVTVDEEGTIHVECADTDFLNDIINNDANWVTVEIFEGQKNREYLDYVANSSSGHNSRFSIDGNVVSIVTKDSYYDKTALLEGMNRVRLSPRKYDSQYYEINVTTGVKKAPDDVNVQYSDGYLILSTSSSEWLEQTNCVEIYQNNEHITSYGSGDVYGNTRFFRLCSSENDEYNYVPGTCTVVFTPGIHDRRFTTLEQEIDHSTSSQYFKTMVLGSQSVDHSITATVVIKENGDDIVISSDDSSFLSALTVKDKWSISAENFTVVKPEYETLNENGIITADIKKEVLSVTGDLDGNTFYKYYGEFDWKYPFGYITFVNRNTDEEITVRNTVTDTVLTVKNKAITLSSATLKKYGISKGEYEVYLYAKDYDSLYTSFTYEGIRKEVPTDIKVTEDTNGNLHISSLKDSDFVKNLRYVDIYGENGNCSLFAKDFHIEGNEAIADAVNVSLENGQYTIYGIGAFGYKWYDKEINLTIAHTKLKDEPDYLLSLNRNNDLVISCTDNAWLLNLTNLEGSDGSGELMIYRTEGKREYIINHGLYYGDTQYVLNLDEDECRLEDGKLIIYNSTLKRGDRINGTYNIDLSVKGYRKGEPKSIYLGCMKEIVPDDLTANMSGSNIVVRSNNSYFLNSVNEVYVRRLDSDGGTVESFWVEEDNISSTSTSVSIDMSSYYISSNFRYDICLCSDDFIEADIPLFYTRYYISYENVDGAYNYNPYVYTYKQGAYIDLENASRSGYTFAGWYSDSKFRNRVTEINRSYPSNITLYAKWEDEYRIFRFNANGGTGTMAQMTIYGNEPFPECRFTRAGYEFDCWVLKIDGESYELNDYITTGMLQDGLTYTLYAKWKTASYDLVLDTQGGELALNRLPSGFLEEDGNYVGTYSSASSFTLPTPEKSGYKFDGWYTDPDNSKTKVTKVNKSLSGDIVLYAKWTALSYTIRYVTNSGSIVKGAVYSTKYGVDTYSIDLPQKADMTKKGYEFEGWYLTYNGKTKVCEDKVEDISDIIAEDTYRNVTLYANWMPISYCIVFDKCDSKAEGAMDDMVVDYDETVALNLNSYVKPGYTFAGWSVEGTGKSFADGAKVKNLADSSDTIYLNAKWKKVSSYTIKYNTNGGKLPKAAPVKYVYEEGNTFVLPIPERAGYRFIGWYTSKEFETGTEITEIDPYNDYQNFNLYAEWTPKTYGIDFYVDGESYSYDEYEYSSNSKDRYELEPLEKFGYTFSWYSDPACKKAITYIARNSAKDIAVYGKFTPGTYKISYNLEKGVSNGSKNPTSYTYSVHDVVYLNNPVNKGKAFKGWYYIDDGYVTYLPYDGERYFLDASFGENITLFAMFSQEYEKYRINYIDDSEEELDNPDTYTYDTPTFRLLNPGRPGYTFTGWYNTATNKKVTQIVKGSMGSIELEARYVKNTYSIVFDKNGATSGSMKTVTAAYDEDVVLPENTYSRIGYAFGGWTFVDSDGYETYISDGQTVINLCETARGKAILKAIWNPISYKINFMLDQEATGDCSLVVSGDTYIRNDGSWELTDENPCVNASGDIMLYRTDKEFYTYASYDSPVKLTPSMFVKNGYTITGWYYYGDNGKKVSLRSDAEVSKLTAINKAEVDIYPVWTTGYKSIVYNANGGTGAMNPTLFVSGDFVNLPTSTYRRTGYTFAGWSYSRNGCSVVPDRSTIDPDMRFNSSITLYARWKPISYSVTFDMNGGTGKETETLDFDYDGILHVYSRPFTKDGKLFMGWAKSKTAKVPDYPLGSEISELTTVEGKNITLYAVYGERRIRIGVCFNGEKDYSDVLAQKIADYFIDQRMRSNQIYDITYKTRGDDNCYSQSEQINEFMNEGFDLVVVSWYSDPYGRMMRSQSSSGVTCVMRHEPNHSGFDQTIKINIPDNAAVGEKIADIISSLENGGDINNDGKFKYYAIGRYSDIFKEQTISSNISSALTDKGINVETEPCYTVAVNDEDIKITTGYLLEEFGDDIDAFICLGDGITSSALEKLSDKGLEVGTDFYMISFDNQCSTLTMSNSREITANLAVDSEDVAKKAADTAMDILFGRIKVPSGMSHIRSTSQFVVMD